MFKFNSKADPKGFSIKITGDDLCQYIAIMENILEGTEGYEVVSDDIELDINDLETEQLGFGEDTFSKN